ncbi:hypothetical protein THAOC_11481 [Thalassiosira oceanica]|uniref:Uncharacterized protein n=1 Tax=Thalassiosira oceanica TaxID=159749 RepID=K0SMD8_THAOC|nr:hypothetical protein THAOC_11481 [Thalassiosira oceanica]|eukprot:EJK67478.1 hypothetical protein THAOC_11481 [Thalassiosira oceanica]
MMTSDDLDLDIEVGSDGKVLVAGSGSDECTIGYDDESAAESASVLTLPESTSGGEPSTGRRCRRMLALSAMMVAVFVAFFFVGYLAMTRPGRSSETSQIVSRSENADVGPEFRLADAVGYVSNDEPEEDADSASEDEGEEDDEFDECKRFLEAEGFRDIDLDLLTDHARGFTLPVKKPSSQDEEEVFSTSSVNEGTPPVVPAGDSDATESSSEKRRRCENRMRKLSLRDRAR